MIKHEHTYYFVILRLTSIIEPRPNITEYDFIVKTSSFQHVNFYTRMTLPLPKGTTT